MTHAKDRVGYGPHIYTQYTEEDYTEIERKALACCRGRYQRGIIYGDYCMSGAGLAGAARNYSKHYKWSRENLLARLEESGLNPCLVRGHKNKIILLLGPDAEIEEV